MASIHPVQGCKWNIPAVCVSQSDKLSAKSNLTTQTVLKCIAKAFTRVVNPHPPASTMH